MNFKKEKRNLKKNCTVTGKTGTEEAISCASETSVGKLVMNKGRNILILRSCPLPHFNKAMNWLKSVEKESKLSVLVQFDVARNLNADDYEDMLLTGTGKMSVARLEEDIKEKIIIRDFDCMIIPCNNRRFEGYDNLLLLADVFKIPQIVLWESEDNLKRLDAEDVTLFLWKQIFSKGFRSLIKIPSRTWKRMFWRKKEKPTASGNEKGPDFSGTIEAFDPVLGRILHKGIQYGKYRGSNFGFRENVPVLNLESMEPSRKPRIVLLGGSTVYGVGIGNDGDTISSQMTILLKETYGIDAEVLNYGITGGWSHSESSLLIYRLIYTKPDIVISFSGWNDFISVWSVKYRYGENSEILNWSLYDYYHYLSIQAPYEIPRHDVSFSEKELVKRHYPYLDRDFLPRSGKDIRESLWGNNLDIMAMVAENFGIHFLGILQPHAQLQKAREYPEFKEWLKQSMNFYFLKDVPKEQLWEDYTYEINRMYNQYSHQLKELDKKYRDSYFMDFSGIFEEETEKCFINVIHYTEYGVAVIAEKITAALAEKRLLDKWR